MMQSTMPIWLKILDVSMALIAALLAVAIICAVLYGVFWTIRFFWRRYRRPSALEKSYYTPLPIAIDQTSVSTIMLVQTGRGFMRGEFLDRYNTKCYIQESSLAGEPCIWLGTESAQMHLTQIMASDLIPLLQLFLRTGALRK